MSAIRTVDASSCSIKVDKKIADKIADLFFKLDFAVFDNVSNTGQTITEVLVPVLRKSKSIDSVSLDALKNQIGILEVGCSDQGIRNQCSIWFVSSQISRSQIDQLISETIPANSIEKFNFVDIQPLLISTLRSEIEKSKTPEKMIILDPFSFKVLDGEKDIAGAQLILVLGVFLLSGFVLGFWARSKDKDKR